MKIPDATSPAALEAYLAGKRTAGSEGVAWRNISLSVLAVPSAVETHAVPSVNEPFITWITSGEADLQEREPPGPWLTCRIKRGSLFISAPGAPYEVRWKTVTDEPFQAVIALLNVSLFEQALDEVFGPNAKHARLLDVSGFEDRRLVALLEQLQEEFAGPASPLLVDGIAQAIAVHLARNYTALSDKAKGETSALPGFKLRRITDWMADHLTEGFNLRRLADQVGMSEFHFNRLFRRATGIPPSQYHIKLRMDMAGRLLRETNKSVITIANEVGYQNPGHFAQMFRKETGLSPTRYRKGQ